VAQPGTAAASRDADHAVGATAGGPDALFAAALDHQRNGRRRRAERAYRELLAIVPDHADALDLLGVIAYQDGRQDEAIALFDAAIRSNPDNAGYHSHLGSVQQQRGDLAAAIASFDRAIALSPTFANAHYNRGNALHAMHRPKAAIASYRQALAIDPGHVRSIENLGYVLKESGQVREALACFRRAVEIDPGSVLGHGHIASILWSRGRLRAAAAAYRRALAGRSDQPRIHSDLIYLLTYNELESEAEILAEARRWEQFYGRPATAAAPHRNDPDPGRRLRVGYVSPDFRGHCVAHFVEPLLAAHDRRQIEVFCYAEVGTGDATTRRFEALADHWRPTVGQSDDAVAAQVRDDRIDILIDLAGHTANSRLQVFARKPAPVQATWIGFLGTTGLGAIDYIIATEALIPQSQRRHYAETVFDIPGYATFEAPGPLPDPAPAPVAARGHVTFGCYNNAAKIGGAPIAAWCRILERVPGSRLVLKSSPLADAETRAAFGRRFAAAGADPTRIELRGPSAYQDYLRSYGDIDIALDPFPANGGTTTRDTLLMGVPLVTLRGRTLPGRVGAAILAEIGLDDLVADTVDAYVDVAVALAGDPARLAALRGDVRRRLRQSGLSDTPTLTRRIEAAYRTMWQRWCAGQAST
jgi:protein O-GlcNAc transferase